MARRRKNSEYGGLMKMNVHLSEDLRKEYKRRAFPIRTGDKVKILRGSFKGSTGKVLTVINSKSRLQIEGIERTKADGSKIRAPIASSNVEIIEFTLSDEKRKKKLKISDKKVKEKKTAKISDKKQKEKVKK